MRAEGACRPHKDCAPMTYTIMISNHKACKIDDMIENIYMKTCVQVCRGAFVQPMFIDFPFANGIGIGYLFVAVPMCTCVSFLTDRALWRWILSDSFCRSKTSAAQAQRERWWIQNRSKMLSQQVVCCFGGVLFATFIFKQRQRFASQ